jgi:hypothetical protein
MELRKTWEKRKKGTGQAGDAASCSHLEIVVASCKLRHGGTQLLGIHDNPYFLLVTSRLRQKHRDEEQRTPTGSSFQWTSPISPSPAGEPGPPPVDPTTTSTETRSPPTRDNGERKRKWSYRQISMDPELNKKKKPGQLKTRIIKNRTCTWRTTSEGRANWASIKIRATVRNVRHAIWLEANWHFS